MPYEPKEKVNLPDGWAVKAFDNPNATNNYHTFISPTGKRFDPMSRLPHPINFG